VTRRLRAAYVIAANTALLLLAAEVVAHVAVTAYRGSGRHVTYASMPAPVRRAYAHMAPPEIEQLWLDTLASRWRYQPIVGFVSEAMQSRYVNINTEGFRSNGTMHGTMDGAVWSFGGSTTFGYGVADNETIPAALESRLRQPVFNFGVPGHFSIHETRLLGHYLRIGFRPSVAVFLDGVNESCEADLAQDRLGELVALSKAGYHWQPSLPVVIATRLLFDKASRMIGLSPSRVRDDLELQCQSAGRTFMVADLHVRALAERAALCAHYQITCRTFIQPFAGLHGRHDQPSSGDAAVADNLRGLFSHLQPVWARTPVTMLTGALDDLPEHAYVDDAHYSAVANARIAAAMAAALGPVRP
jgi:hypothetical protein